MRARMVLHLAAVLLPMLPLVAWKLFMERSLDWNSVWAILLFTGPAIVAAQLAAWMRWNALKARVHSTGNAWPTGLGMAVITHLLFGVLLALTLLMISVPDNDVSVDSWWQVPMMAVFFAFVSLSLTGIVTLPATAWIAQWVGRLYLREQTHEPA